MTDEIEDVVPAYQGLRQPLPVRRESRPVPSGWVHESTAEGFQHLLSVGVENATEAERRATFALFPADGRSSHYHGADLAALEDNLNRYYAMMGVPIPGAQPMTLREKLCEANQRLRDALGKRVVRVTIDVLAGQLGITRQHLYALAKDEDPQSQT